MWIVTGSVIGAGVLIGGYGVPNDFLRADGTFIRNIRLPYQKFNRQPLAN